MTQKLLLECLHFFKELDIEIEDVSTEADIANGNKVVQATYKFKGKNYKTKRLYYKEITGLDNVRYIQSLHQYFGEKVYWLDIEKHQWPKPSGESDLDNLVIDDIVSENDEDFKTLLLLLANNNQTGYIQQITRDGRPAQYYHNLENNNHWHDLILFIKKTIAIGGQDVGKQFFEHLVFNWDKGKRTSLNAGAPYKIVTDLYNNIKQIQSMLSLNNIKSLLQYKNQIILQGPPGTGKTRTAKEVAEQLIVPQKIQEEDILSFLNVGDRIKSGKDYTSYVARGFTDDKLMLENESGNPFNISFSEIIKAFENRTWETETLTNGNQSASAGIAKFICKQFLSRSKQFKLIQFHPSYTYEDFVRGIIAESKGDKIEYKNVNKILGKLAKEANENYELSKQDNSAIQQEKWIEESFNDFKEDIRNQIEQQQVILSGNIGVFDMESDCFRYGKDWGVPSRINFVDFKNLIKAKLDGNLIIDQNKVSKELSVHAHYRFTYYLALLRIFFNKYQFTKSSEQEKLKNFVLIIDEINRANLSSVLGEMIYALEYRGEVVESMYAVNGSNKLVLPLNLYIIGTMNTADRSVGHIDYAIRRRFAFWELLPSEQVIDDVVPDSIKLKAKALFKNVAILFIQGNVAPDFKASDVQLGHSYFLAKSEEELKLKLEYEIKPLLKEYLTDGILLSNVTVNGRSTKTEDYINQLSF